MKPLRILYVVALVASLGLAFSFYYKYQLRSEELVQYQELSLYSDEVFKMLTTKLAQSKIELKKSSKEVERLNKTIAALEKGSLSFKGELEAFKKEREALQVKIARLLEEKTVLEKRFLSLKELQKAIKVAKAQEHQGRKMEKAQKRLTQIAMLKKLDEIALKQGNRGYLVCDGRSTFKSRARVKVELLPISNFSYSK